MTAEVYFLWEGGLDELAAFLVNLLNLPTTNTTPGYMPQRRNGVNYGGDYHVFEVLGLVLHLVNNAGETEIPEKNGHRFYLMLAGASPATLRSIAEHIAELAVRNGVPAEADSLAS